VVLLPFERMRSLRTEAEGDFETLQDRIDQFDDKLVAQPHLDGRLIEDIAITTGSNDISHKLGRTMRGWWTARDEHATASFRVYLGTNQTTVATGDTIAFDTETYDHGSNFDSTTAFTFTAPVSGIYTMTAAVRVDALADSETLLAYISNSVADDISGQLSERGGAADGIGLVSGTIQLTKDETSEVLIFYSAGTHTVEGNANATAFSGFLHTGLHEETSPNEADTLRLHSDCDRTLGVVVY